MTSPTGAVVSDELQATAPERPALRYAIAAIAVAMSLYHMHVAAFGPPEAVIFRGTHLLFALTLVYLLYPFRAGRPAAWRLLDLALLAAGWGCPPFACCGLLAATARTSNLTAHEGFFVSAAFSTVFLVIENESSTKARCPTTKKNRHANYFEFIGSSGI